MTTNNQRQSTNKGFTLIEMMVALSIFIIVMTISMTAIVGVFDANRKSRSLKAVLNNLNLAVESMSKEMRFGTNYACSPCSGGAASASFISSLSGNPTITYRLNNQALEKRVSPSTNFIPVTAPEIVINDLSFTISGAAPGDGFQPKAFMKIRGYAGATGKGRTDFTLQTLISQRFPDS